MRDFINRFELELARAADRPAAHARRRRGRLSDARPRIVAVALAGVAALAIALVVSFSGSGPQPAAALPVLAKPAVNAGSLRAHTPALVSAGAQYTQARTISTPYGTGFVIPSSDGNTICLAIPDTVPDSYGQSCVATSKAEREGLTGMLLAATGSNDSSELVTVLPVGTSTATMTHPGGSPSTLTARDGVIAATFTQDTTVSWNTATGTRTVSVPAHEPEGRRYVDCGDGTMRPLPAGETYNQVCSQARDKSRASK